MLLQIHSLQELHQVREDDLHKKCIQREREIEEERQQQLEDEKRHVLRQRINQKKAIWMGYALLGQK